MRALRACVLSLLSLAMTVGLVLTGPPAYAESQAGTYKPIRPARLLDTRSGLGAPRVAVGAGRTVSVAVLGRGGVPSSNVTAVVATVTGTRSTARTTYLTAYPTGSARPAVSSLNLHLGQTRANTVTVPVGSDGRVSLFNQAGTTEVLLDVVGYYVRTGETAAGSDLYPVEPTRVLDTRPGAPVGARQTGFLDLDFGFDNPYVRAVAVNLTAVGATGGGYLTVWDGAGARPTTSVLSFGAQRTVPAMTVIPTSTCGATDCPEDPTLAQFAFYNGSSGTVDLLVDVVGVYLTSASGNGLRFAPFAPRRIIDTRTGLGGRGQFGPAQTQTFLPGPVVRANTFALVGNLAVVAPTSSTYLTTWPDGARPDSSNLNSLPGSTVANGALVQFPQDSFEFRIYNSAGRSHVLLDVAGRFDDPTLPAARPVATDAQRRTGAQQRRAADLVRDVSGGLRR